MENGLVPRRLEEMSTEVERGTENVRIVDRLDRLNKNADNVVSRFTIIVRALEEGAMATQNIAEEISGMKKEIAIVETKMVHIHGIMANLKKALNGM